MIPMQANLMLPVGGTGRHLLFEQVMRIRFYCDLRGAAWLPPCPPTRRRGAIA
jgi:hypothetical protein